MADPSIAPVGSRFVLRWRADAYVEMENHFQVRDHGVERVEISKGRPPRKGNTIKGKFAPVPLRGKMKALLTIEKDGEPNGFRDKPLEATHTEKMGVDGAYYHEYSFIFVASQVGDYVFTVKYDFEPSPAKSALTAPPTLVKKVKVTPGEELNERRKDMLALIDKWFPSSVIASPKIPPGEDPKNGDILAQAGWQNSGSLTWAFPARFPAGGPAEPKLNRQGLEKWDQADGASEITNAPGLGQVSAAKKAFNAQLLPARQAAYDALKLSDEDKKKNKRPAGVPIATSCIDVLRVLLKKWGDEFLADMETMTKPNKSYYVMAAEEYAKPNPTPPKPGDLLFLVLENDRGFFQHVCILVSASSEVWTTADGGGGATPEQTATISNKPLSWPPPKRPLVPMFASVTDGKDKALHGWVDLDKVTNNRYNADGSRKAT